MTTEELMRIWNEIVLLVQQERVNPHASASLLRSAARVDLIKEIWDTYQHALTYAHRLHPPADTEECLITACEYVCSQHCYP